jgi:hypothetical protein
MQDGAEQVGSGLARVVSAAQGLAVDAHALTGHPTMWEQPAADFHIQTVSVEFLQDTPDGRFRRGVPTLRTQASQRVTAQVFGPLRDGLEAARAGEGGTDANRHHGHQGMTHPAPFARVHQGSQHLHQSAFTVQGKAVHVDHGKGLLSEEVGGRQESRRQTLSGLGMERTNQHLLGLAVGDITRAALGEAARGP